MSMAVVKIFGIILALFGGIVTMVFWIPGLVNRPRLKEILGSRYPLIFIIYGANGPFLLILGLLLYFLSRKL